MGIENVDMVKEEPLCVLILTADAGLGHRRAAEAIAVALRETLGEAQAPLGAVYQVNNYYIPLLIVVTDLAAVHRLWFHDAVDLRLVPTEAVRNQAVQSGVSSDRIHVVGIPVHPDLAREDWDRETLRAELGWRGL